MEVSVSNMAFPAMYYILHCGCSMHPGKFTSKLSLSELSI
jgi:hypothetical protein